MSVLQIVLLSLIGASTTASIVFMVMFVLEICLEKKEKKVEEKEVPTVFTLKVEEVKEEKEETDVDLMLASIEEQTKGEVCEEAKPEELETNEEVEEVSAEEIVEEVPAETVEVEAKEEVQEETIENLAALDETAEDESSDEDDSEILSNIEELKNADHEVVQTGNALDYSARLEKIIETRNKIERDLAKIQKSILKYERTKRRKNRNQQMLDRRAGELTNLNLVMYSVTDIKNVDEDKKIKQEELTAHIAELKASIQDADEFIESNKEKNEHNVKMAKFLIQEKVRYNEEIAELQALINNTEDNK